jgi:predicted MPP superfamily phosphohydrolase
MGLRVLQLSDLHIDGIDGLDEIVGDMVARLPVDICVLTGDYRYRLHGDCTEVYRRIQRILNRVDSVHGTFGILGNHDTAAMALELEQIGVRMLVNESIEIRREGDSIWIAGVDDPYEFRCADLELALETAPPDAFRILLAHTPQLAGEAAFHGIDLYLCGHTHAGQIQIPGLGPVISSGYGRRRFVHGLWEHGGTQGYTSAGVGCSMLPVRFNCPPEIVLFELHNFDSAVRRN